MREYYYKYNNGNDQHSGLVAAADEHAAYQQITDMIENMELDPDADFWEYIRVDNLLDS